MHGKIQMKGKRKEQERKEQERKNTRREEITFIQ